MRKAFFLTAAAVLLLGMAAAACGPARSREPKPRAEKAAKTMSVRYVVKLTPAAADLFLRKNLRRSLKAEELPVEALKSASEARKISSWKPVYPEPLAEDVVGLNRMYLLAADEETSIRATVEAFEALTDWVEYIEPGEPGA